MKSYRIEGYRLPMSTFKEVANINVVDQQLSRTPATQLCSVTVSPPAESSGRARINAVGEMSLQTASSPPPFDRAWGTAVAPESSHLRVV
jgi:hypothetical protein